MEEANFLTKFATEVHIVHRRDELRASKIMQDRAKANEKITWGLNKTPIEVIADGKVTGLKVKDNETGEEEIIETDGIFIAIGHRPNTEFLNGQVKIDEAGYIVVKPERQRQIYREYLHVEMCKTISIVKQLRLQELVVWLHWIPNALENHAVHDWSQSL